MAVQAQYPSNIFLLNRNAPEGKDMLAGGDYTLQVQASGYLDQSPMLFPNGAAPGNSRKRGREANPPSLSPINLFSLQSKPAPPTLVSLAQLHNQPQPCMVSTGLGLSLQDQPQDQQQHGQLGPLKSSSLVSSFLTEDLASQIKEQSDEIDQFLRAQGEQLRRQLAERRERHYRALLGAAEESALQRLRQTEAEVEKAARRRAELEERMGRLEAEAQAWRARARAQEAAAASLQAQLQQAMITARSSGAGAQDKGEEIGCSAEDAESAHVDPDRVEVVSGSGPMCRACRKRYASAVLIPCRHLCVCTECDSVVRSCPICRVPRSGSVQVYLS